MLCFYGHEACFLLTIIVFGSRFFFFPLWAISIVCHKVHHIFLFGNKNRWCSEPKRRVFLCYQPIILHMCCPNIFAALQWAKSGILVKSSHMPNWIEKLIYFTTFWVKYVFSGKNYKYFPKYLNFRAKIDDLSVFRVKNSP